MVGFCAVCHTPETYVQSWQTNSHQRLEMWRFIQVVTGLINNRELSARASHFGVHASGGQTGYCISRSLTAVDWLGCLGGTDRLAGEHYNRCCIKTI